MPLLGSSQSGYPSKIVVEGDTLIAFTLDQSRFMIKVKYDLEECVTIVDTLRHTIQSDSILLNQMILVDSINKKKDITQDGLIETTSELNSALTEALNKERTGSKRLKNLARFLGGFTIIETGILTVILLLK